MRSTDSDPIPKPPLGEKVTPKTLPSPPTWKPKPDAPGIEIGPDGKLRTNIPENDKCLWPHGFFMPDGW